MPQELVRLVEGLALRRPRSSVATVARQAALVGAEHGWPASSYSTVHAIVTGLDPHLLTLAHDGPTALRDRYELVYRRQADRPNQIWQADHTELDLLVLDAVGSPARPGLSVVLDDCSRAVAGCTLFLGAAHGVVGVPGVECDQRGSTPAAAPRPQHPPEGCVRRGSLMGFEMDDRVQADDAGDRVA